MKKMCVVSIILLSTAAHAQTAPHRNNSSGSVIQSPPVIIAEGRSSDIACTVSRPLGKPDEFTVSASNPKYLTSQVIATCLGIATKKLEDMVRSTQPLGAKAGPI